MFYSQKEIEKLLKCPQCKSRLTEPIMLPCGKSICKKCADSIAESEKNMTKKVKCPFCDQNHHVPSKGYLQCELLTRLLMKKPNHVFRSKCVEYLEKNMKEIEENATSIESSLGGSIEKIQNYFHLLQEQLRLKSDSLIEKIRQLEEQMRQEIDKQEKECVDLFKDDSEYRNALEFKIKRKRNFNRHTFAYLNKFEIDENEISRFLNFSLEHLNELSEMKSDLKAMIFNNKSIVFEENTKEVDSSILGKLVDVNFDSVILNSFQIKRLMQASKFCEQAKWKLIYRASTDGMNANAFHAKCDNTPKTLTVIKAKEPTCFIRGGYTEMTWNEPIHSGSCSSLESDDVAENISNHFSAWLDYYYSYSKTDSNTFFFNYIDENNIEISKEHEIICCKRFGPSFLAEQDVRLISLVDWSESDYSNSLSSISTSASDSLEDNKTSKTSINDYDNHSYDHNPYCIFSSQENFDFSKLSEIEVFALL
jgi:hypothetical protein